MLTPPFTFPLHSLKRRPPIGSLQVCYENMISTELPRAVQNAIDECGDVVDVSATVTTLDVAVGSLGIVHNIFTKNHINQTSDVININLYCLISIMIC